MRRFVYRLVTLLALLIAQGAAAQLVAGKPHLSMRLVPETARPASGGTVTLAFVTMPDPGWHGYWKNGGDAGLETQLGWTLPRGVTAGPIAYPVPGRLIVAGLMNYVYEKPFVNFVDLTIPAGIAAGTRLPVTVKADYLVCTTTICVPESQTLSAELTVGDGTVDPARRAEFDAWRQKLPRPLGSVAQYQADADGTLRLAVPLPAAASVEQPYFYPLTTGAIDYAAPQAVGRDGDMLTITTKGKGKGAIEGVLATGEGRGLTLRAEPGAVAAVDTGFPWTTLALSLGGAVLGGLLLNIMPCVFPILSLKALSLVRSGGSEAHARGEALAYSAGVILMCVALGGGLLAIRAAGSSAGWAFQLQDPRVILVLLLLVTGIALNLAGLFELPAPAFANRLAASGKGGAFATGALAAFVATPCTGPFMGAALGAALVLPWFAALAVFAGLGLGIALPFLLLGFVPALRRRLPKPGAWMETFRHILSVPMFLTALALAWILGRQAGVDGMTLGLGAALIVALGLWWSGRRQRRGVGWIWVPLLVALVTAVPAVWTIRPQAAGANATAAAVAGAEPFSEARLAALQAEHRPVFAYFTADWCLTCKVNEKAAIETQTAHDAFAKANVAVLVGDWTDGDPVLGRFIEAHNRAGVPLYLWYDGKGGAARVLPQVLTPGMLAALPAQ